MKNLTLKILSLLFLVLIVHSCDEPLIQDQSDETIELKSAPGLQIAQEKLQDVMDLQDQVTNALFNNPEVVGTGTGVDAKGNPTIVVYTLSKVEQRADVNLQNVGRGTNPTALPLSIENVPIVPKTTGMFKAYADPKARFPRPVPIGVSTGHPDITAGTIGCRVKDVNGNVYALSNNHVFANSNLASLGDNILQPGPYDGGIEAADVIGTLYEFEEIIMDGPDNKMDAALASISTGTLGFSTFLPGYGTPSSTTIDTDAIAVGMAVQKCGRTTGWTHGTISEINVTLNVCYVARGPVKCASYARFVDQIAITPGTFSDGGDSGSLIVTDDDNKNPVGLLFAGSADRTIASNINVVLNRFNVTIDDGSGGTSNFPPTANFSFTTTDLTVDFTDTSSDPEGPITTWSWDFGDGSTSTVQNPSHSYGAYGTYTVTLTVTDNDDATGFASKDVTVTEPNVGGITLSVSGRKVKGAQKADLTWSGATGENVDIYRDGVKVATTENDGSFTDPINNKGGGSYDYWICEAGTSACSDVVTLTF